jgi:hypothetical protein
VKVIERVVERTIETTTPVEHDLRECVARVTVSPTGCRNVANALIPLAKDRTLFDDPKWSAALRALAALQDAIVDAPRPRRPW